MNACELILENEQGQNLAGTYKQLKLEYDAETSSLWFFMHGSPRPCFTPVLLNEIQNLFNEIETFSSPSHPVQYLVAASGVEGVFNLGGDLDLFRQFVLSRDREGLRQYAYSCLNMGFQCTTQFNRDITTIALIQGSALGGGFEAALSCNIVIAEESAQLGFPEILFNLFPGMGAHSYLSRRVCPSIIEKLITSGRSFTARELFDMGVIEELAPDGEGEKTTRALIKKHKAQRNARIAMEKSRQRVNPVSLQELRDIADIWVEAALELNERSLRVMERLVRAQSKKMKMPISCTST